MRILPHDAITIPEHAKLVFSGRTFDVYQWPQQLFDGTTATFEMLKRPDTVEFIAVHDGKLLLIREEQPGRDPVLRLPGGRADPGETWRQAVERECAEELGMFFRSWRLVMVSQPLRKIEWFVAVYIATDLARTAPTNHEAGERIELMPMEFTEARRLVDEDSQAIRYLRPLFAKAHSLEELQQLPECKGRKA